jgi:hypothetical protein
MNFSQRLRTERGAIIIQAAIAGFVLIGLTGFVVDYGIFWLAREQAQQAADTGAMAGALARAYGDPDPDAPVPPIVRLQAEFAVAQNPVWFDADAGKPVVSSVCPPELVAIRCVRVDVFRDGTSGSTAIPTVFAPLFGITSQGVRATATARVAVGNGTLCMKPWAIPDKWVEQSMPPTSYFERYVEPGGGETLPFADSYSAPTEMSAGSGMTLSDDLGQTLILDYDTDPEGTDPIKPQFLLPLVLNGPSTYAENIAGCNGSLARFGQSFPTGTTARAAETAAAATALIALDPGASWDLVTNTVQGSCAPGCAPVSPRLVALALFDVDLYQLMRATDNWCPGNQRCVRVVNLVGFFIDLVGGNSIIGNIARYPGVISADYPSVIPTASFLPTVTLVR